MPSPQDDAAAWPPGGVRLADVLRACGVDLERLRGDLRNYITLELSNLV